MSRELRPCGTRAAYRRHIRRGEQACADCLRAENVPRERQVPLFPCGTAAAYRRHTRRGEPPCDDCTAAERRKTAGRQGYQAGALTPDTRELRNGLRVVQYEYRARRYPWAVRVLARAEAAWGRPEDEEAA